MKTLPYGGITRIRFEGYFSLPATLFIFDGSLKINRVAYKSRPLAIIEMYAKSRWKARIYIKEYDWLAVIKMVWGRYFFSKKWYKYTCTKNLLFVFNIYDFNCHLLLVSHCSANVAFHRPPRALGNGVVGICICRNSIPSCALPLITVHVLVVTGTSLTIKLASFVNQRFLTFWLNQKFSCKRSLFI